MKLSARDARAYPGCAPDAAFLSYDRRRGIRTGQLFNVPI